MKKAGYNLNRRRPRKHQFDGGCSPVAESGRNDWTRPQALAIPKEGYFKLEQGRYGPVFPRTPACHGFTIIAKIKPGKEQVIREYGKTLEKALETDPYVLVPLRLHYLR
jgi:hypothetical protein